jgi:hypothetical protein
MTDATTRGAGPAERAQHAGRGRLGSLRCLKSVDRYTPELARARLRSLPEHARYRCQRAVAAYPAAEDGVNAIEVSKRRNPRLCSNHRRLQNVSADDAISTNRVLTLWE